MRGSPGLTCALVCILRRSYTRHGQRFSAAVWVTNRVPSPSNSAEEPQEWAILGFFQGLRMSDSSLTNEQAQKLLHELATNDMFRTRFQEKPAAALVELGIPHETVINLNAACLIPLRLAAKDDFREAHQQLVENQATHTESMIIPHHLKL